MSSSPKNWSGKGLCGRSLSEFIDWRYSQSCWHFRPSFVKCCTSNLLSGSTLPRPLFPVSKFNIYLQCVAGMGWGCWVLLDTIFCRSLTLCIWSDSEPTILLDPKQIPRRGGGLREINACRKVQLQVNLFRWQRFALVSNELFIPWSSVRSRLCWCSLSGYNNWTTYFCLWAIKHGISPVGSSTGATPRVHVIPVLNIWKDEKTMYCIRRHNRWVFRSVHIIYLIVLPALLHNELC